MLKNNIIAYCSFILLVSIAVVIRLSLPQYIRAAPYFYMQAGSSAIEDVKKFIPVYLNTDGSTLTAAQTVISFDTDYLTGSAISNLGSRCSFWAPADPSLGYGNTSTPYFYNSNRAVLSCGFSNPGYTTGASAKLIATLSFNPEASGSTSLSFGNTQFRYIGSTVTAGTSPDFDLDVYGSTQSANEAQPSPTPTTASTTSSDDSSSTTTTTTASDTISEDDLNFVEITQNSKSSNTTTTNTDGITLEAVDEDDTIPAVPQITKRPAPSPFVFSQSALEAATASADQEDQGEVLSVSSLRELLIPGKSSADKTVVMVNFISTLTFITLLAVALWRMITVSRLNKVKYQHMQDMITGELSTLQSKMGGLAASSKNPNANVDIKNSFDNLMNSLQEDPKIGKKKK